MKYCLPFFILFFLASNVFGQNNQISGAVLSKADSTTLEFAHIYIKNSTIGTYSNTDGKFIFNYPDSLSSDTLVITRIGYNDYSFVLSTRVSSELNVYLKESDLYLDEVVITASQDTVTAIIKKVLKNIRKNYPTKLHYFEGFYREISTKGDQYTRLIEASMGITENSYRKQQTTSTVKVRQIRKSEDYREYSIKNKLYAFTMKKATKLAFGKLPFHYNNIYRLLSNSVLKNSGKIMLVGKECNFIDEYDFEITKITNDNNTLYYHIAFQQPPEENSPTGYSGGHMIINMDDYAIVDFVYSSIPHPYKRHNNIEPDNDPFYFKGKYHSQKRIIYSKIGEKYYPTLFERHEPILETTMHIDKETGKKEFQYNKITFMVNEVITRKRDFDRIKKREALEDDIDLYDIDQPYDSAFWANYNILLLDPLLTPAVEDLEKEKTLEEQFQQDGK